MARFRQVVHGAIVAVAAALASAAAGAVVLGQNDDFESGTAGWETGAFNLTPPVVIDDGGPLGAGDAWLQLTASGGFGAGSRLTVIAGPQWNGDYVSSGVSAIRMDVNNLGATDLALRLWLQSSPLSAAISSDAVLVPAASGWTSVTFPLNPAALAGDAGALSSVTQLRLFHSEGPAFPGPAIVALLGVDNVSAVPEPTRALTLALGLALLGAVRWRRRAAG